ncbi:sulfate adenylyltransferase subunit CysN [Agaribacterium haliotis]|uniref:sulfate adenylyltransferase subunit CysN n=1 Tax=Agaribacterium haliotis TaxID=2013869 RepID=UPI000BB598C0|nr:sulfate adenylyltransferase subunit CysN [Agaribacterium haliotis]
MSHQSDLIAEDIHQYLKQHEEKDLLRFITCGSVDDGKSTLIGRLLHDTKMIYEDQLAAISKDSKTHGTTGEKIDLALLVDGLQSEREQGITIDVAYRYFSTDKRKFIIADTPGHEQYTRNMATGASTASMAILLIDARYGVQTQTRRHSFICSLLGIKHFVIAVNKMDLIDFSQEKFDAIQADYEAFAKSLPSQPEFTFIPISALDGDNVAGLSEKSPWYQGQPLLDILESIDIADDENTESKRFPVQYVNRPNLNFRGFCGTVAAGVFKAGDEVMALPSHKKSTVKEVVTYEGTIDAAYPGDAVTLTLNDEIDISRGDMIVAANDSVKPVNAMMIDVVWMHEDALEVGKSYYVKVGTAEVSGTVTDIEYQVDVNTLEKSAVQSLPLNGIARVKLELTEAVCVDAYQQSRHTGNLIFIDRLTNVTVGAAMVVEALDQEQAAWHKLELNRQTREASLGQKATALCVYGDAASGYAAELEKALFASGLATYVVPSAEAGVCSALLDAGLFVVADLSAKEADSRAAFYAQLDESATLTLALGKDVGAEADISISVAEQTQDEIIAQVLRKLREFKRLA